MIERLARDLRAECPTVRRPESLQALREEHGWHAAEATDHGWTLAVLEHQIATKLHRRVAAAPANFAQHLPSESDLAQQLTRDPYVFELSRP